MRFDSERHSPIAEDASSSTVTFGEMLRAYRLRAGLSQELLAERAQISAEAVSSLERGTRRSPYRSTVALLANALDLGAKDREAFEAARRTVRRQPARNDVTAQLPTERTSFVGREGDIANIVQILGRSRLLTLTGSGGVGKTRTAIEAARRIGSASWDEVWFVDLAPLTEGASIPSKIAMTIEPHLTDQRDTLAGLASALASRRMLLIFDNCEHIIAAAAHAVSVLLDGCPQLVVLATSRETLNISGEFVYRLPPLSLPDAMPIGLEDAQAYSAVDLFVQRAELADTRMAVSVENLETIVCVARRLDGIPLAIELAAAQLPTIGLRALRERLDRHLGILPGRRDLPARQRTVYATIAWSYDLLGNEEREVLCTASVFSGGFTLEAAEIVCCAEGGERRSVATVVSSLVNKSLVDVDYVGDAVRYHLLESVQSFARERLRESGREESALRRRAAWLALVADDMYEKYPAEMPIEVSAALVRELDNVRAAVTWSLKAPLSADRSFAGRILSGLYNLSDVTGGRLEHRQLVETALECIDESDHPKVVANLLLAFIMRAHLEDVVLDAIDRAIPLFERNGDRQALLRLQIVLSCAFAEHGKFAEAERSAEEAFTLMRAERLESSMLRASLMANRCLSRILQGRFDEALSDVAEAERVALTYFDDRYFVVSRCDPRVVQIEFERGNLARALEITQRMLSGEYGWVHEVALQAVSGAVNLQLLLGDVAAAAASTNDLLSRTRPTTSSSYAACEYAASVAAMRGHPRSAARLLGFVGAVEERIGFRRMNMRQATYEALRALLERQLDERTFSAELAAGSGLTPEAAIADARAALRLEPVARERDSASGGQAVEVYR